MQPTGSAPLEGHLSQQGGPCAACCSGDREAMSGSPLIEATFALNLGNLKEEKGVND